MTNTTDPPESRRPRLLSARQAGWALTVATLVSLAIGVVVVGVIGPERTPPLQINSQGPPQVENQQTFDILEQDGADAGDHGPVQQTVWVESLFPKAPEPADPRNDVAQ